MTIGDSPDRASCSSEDDEGSDHSSSDNLRSPVLGRASRGGTNGRGGRGRGGRGRSVRGGHGRGGRGRQGRAARGGCGGSDSGRGSGGDTRHWKAEGTEVTVNAFSGFIGPTIPVGEPLDLFLALFTPQLLDQIVTETNHYASDCLSASHDGNGLPPQWQTNAEEVKAYFGICILMGINKLPHLYDYWSMNEYLHYFPVASKIPRKRFLEIHRYLHFTRNDTIVPRGQPGHD